MSADDPGNNAHRSRPRDASANAPTVGPSGHDADHDEREPGLTPKEWRWAYDRAREGFSARSIARILDVPHSTILRAAKRNGWPVRWSRPVPSPSPPAAAAGPERPSPPRGPSPAPVAPQTVPERPPLGPPRNERAARLWVCSRCRQVGFDPNRGAIRAWHTALLCDERMSRLDRVLDDSPRERPLWEMPW